MPAYRDDDDAMLIDAFDTVSVNCGDDDKDDPLRHFERVRAAARAIERGSLSDALRIIDDAEHVREIAGEERACEFVDVERARERRALLNAFGGRLLRVCVRARAYDGIEALLARGASASLEHSRALRVACALGDATSVAALVRGGATVTSAALVCAAACGALECVDALLCAGADAAADDSRALHAAALGAHAAVVERLAAAGADPLARDQAALLEACARHDAPTVRALLAATPRARHRAVRADAAREAARACGVENAELDALLRAVVS